VVDREVVIRRLLVVIAEGVAPSPFQDATRAQGCVQSQGGIASAVVVGNLDAADDFTADVCIRGQLLD
jgi:hypothetical protein